MSHLEPRQLERLHRLGDAQEAVRALAEVEVEHDPHLRPRAVAEGREHVADLAEQRRLVLRSRKPGTMRKPGLKGRAPFPICSGLVFSAL